MPSSALVDLTVGVLEDYSNGFSADRLSKPIRAKRAYVPSFTPGDQDYGVYQVIVSPDLESAKRESRKSIAAEYTIEVGVCCRLRDTCEGTIDPAMVLIQQMGDFFFDYGLSSGIAEWDRNEVYFWPDRDRLKMDGTFFALWDMVFKGLRSR